MIPRKQRSTQEDWSEALAEAYEHPDRERALVLVEDAAGRIVNRCQGHTPVFGWSGGKDSQALRVVCEHARVTSCVLVISDLEYPAFLGWAADNMPWGCYVEARPLDLDWLRAHPDMLFPADAATAGKWFRLIQHEGQRDYFRKFDADVLILGRRRADGNFVGKQSDEYVDREGFVRYSPLANWSHEDVLCVLGAYGVPLPPCYDWPRGFQVGTGSWPARQFASSRAQAWAEVRTIDEGVVKLAASVGLPGAEEALSAA